MKKELKLSDIRKKLPFEIHKGLYIHYAKDLLYGKYGIEIDFEVYLPSKNKNLQRDFVWNLQQKQELILSIFKGIKIPHISIIDFKSEKTNKQIFRIVDGKQRLSSIFSFLKNEFPIIWENEEYFYKDLNEEMQRTISLFDIIADIVYSYEYKNDSKEAWISDDDIITWFELINFAGTPQDIEHLKNLKNENRKII